MASIEYAADRYRVLRLCEDATPADDDEECDMPYCYLSGCVCTRENPDSSAEGDCRVCHIPLGYVLSQIAALLDQLSRI